MVKKHRLVKTLPNNTHLQVVEHERKILQWTGKADTDTVL